MTTEKVTIWKLSDRAVRRFLRGHPWVFANEIEGSPKGHVAGSPVELRSPRGEFLARGYGNPNSLIAFRTLSRRQSELRPWSEEALRRRALSAIQRRQDLGLLDYSFRLVFGESDDLPGLVIDRHLHASRTHQVLVAQIQTKGVENLLPEFGRWMDSWVDQLGLKVEQTTLVIRRDVGSRRQEGLEILPPEVLRPHAELSRYNICLREAGNTGKMSTTPLVATVDLVGGQKTGFFFDQAGNIDLAVSLLRRSNWLMSARGDGNQNSPLSVLDLFCYVGQWSTQIGRAANEDGCKTEVHLIDSSGPALAWAKQNARTAGAAAVFTYELDVMDGLAGAPDCHVVICDPPAFIKSKKDHAAGLKGYVKVNMMALHKVLPSGLFVSCSCSHHLSEGEFAEVLAQAEDRTGRRVRWLAKSGQAPDHPMSLAFPESQYLKCWIGHLD